MFIHFSCIWIVQNIESSSYITSFGYFINKATGSVYGGWKNCIKNKNISFMVYNSETSSPMGNARSPESQHNVCRHHILECSKAGHSELETVIRPKFKQKILCQFCLSASIKKRSEWNEWENLENLYFQTLKGSKLHSQWWDQFEIQTHPSFNACACYL